MHKHRIARMHKHRSAHARALAYQPQNIHKQTIPHPHASVNARTRARACAHAHTQDGMEKLASPISLSLEDLDAFTESKVSVCASVTSGYDFLLASAHTHTWKRS